MKANEFDKKFDNGENISKYLDMSKARIPGQEQKRVNVDFPLWMVHLLYQIQLIRADFIHGNKHKLESLSCCLEIHNQASFTAASRSSIVGYSRLLNFLCLN